MTAQDQIRHRVAFDPQDFRTKDGGLRILLIHKKSRVELQKLELSAVTGDLADEHNQHLQCLSFVRALLVEHKADVLECFRDDISAEKAVGRIIVTIGGDGTVLDSSRIAKESPILGVNSDPKRSVGSLCVGTKDNFEGLFTALNAGTLSYKAVARLGGILDGRDLGILALNEVLVAHQNPAAMSRYTIEVDGHSELHKSSGVWVSTATGSTGAILSAGGHMRPLDDSGLQFLVREPYFSAGKVGRMFSGVSNEVKITSHMTGAKIFFDGPHATEPFFSAQTLILHSRGTPLLLFVSEEMEYRREQMAHLRESIHDQIEGSRKC